MKRKTIYALCAVFSVPTFFVGSVSAQTIQTPVQQFENRLEKLEVAQQGGKIFLRVQMQNPLKAPPASFSIANPARIILDFPKAVNALGRTTELINQGDLSSVNLVQSQGRTRLVLNLSSLPVYDVTTEGNSVVVALVTRSKDSVSGETEEVLSRFSGSSDIVSSRGASLSDVNFRRGKDGEGRVVIQLTDPRVGVDVQTQGKNLVLEFQNSVVPENLIKKYDVSDFGTPISQFVVERRGEKARIVVTPTGQWTHSAYQADNQFVLEVKRYEDDPNKLAQGVKGEYKGEKLSLNFQNIDIRSALQVIADFTNFNIITSDTTQGSITLRLKDVPWDQALDIIMQAKGLDFRKKGNVIWIAPRDELAGREQQELEQQRKKADLEPLQTDSIQVNYHKAKEISEFLNKRGSASSRDRDSQQAIISSRGSVSFDERTNKVFVTDVSSSVQRVRQLISELDVPPRQVLIEARIVEATNTFARDLGVRLGFGGMSNTSIGRTADGRVIPKFNVGSGAGSTEYTGGLISSRPSTGSLLPAAVDLAAAPATGTAGALSFVLWNSAATRYIDMELSALEADNKTKVITRPRVMTANQVEATIEQGTEIPYQEASSSGATTTSFKKAVLSLKVKPQITPDGRLLLKVDVNKDEPIASASGGAPAINTKHVTTEVLIDNGGTVVIGGIFQDSEGSGVLKIPFLGDIPVLGNLFKQTTKSEAKNELLVFLTPRIYDEKTIGK